MDNKIISTLDKEEEIIHETDEALAFQDNILYWTLQITEFTAGRQLPVSPFHYANIEESKPTLRAHIDLPKLQIQPFDSNPLEWLTFWDSFNNAVHNNPNLHNINKMNYLNSMITGDAASATSGLPITSQNYGAEAAVYL